MVYKISLEFESAQELVEFLNKLTPEETSKVTEEQQKVLYSIPNLKASIRRKGKDWEEYEITYLKDNYLTHSYAIIGKSLGRTPASVQQMAFKMIKAGQFSSKKNTARNSKVTTKELEYCFKCKRYIPPEMHKEQRANGLLCIRCINNEK